MTIAEQLKQTPAFRDSCGFLSNFAPYRSGEEHEYEGIKYPSNEHFYQAQKFTDIEVKRRIANHPFKGLKAYCRTLPGMRSDWDTVKEQIMIIGLMHKFSIQRFSDLLIGTDNHELVERNTWGDTYWGVCKDKGQNRLGKILMEIRSKI